MCRVLGVTRQGYANYKKSLNKEDKHTILLAEIKVIIEEDEFNNTYGRRRLHEALVLRGFTESESTINRLCNKHGILKKKKKTKGLTKQSRDDYKSDDLLRGDFKADEPGRKFVTDITQLPTADGTLYISALFDCFDNVCDGLSMDDNMKTPLVIKSVEIASMQIPTGIKTICHGDRGSQYTSYDFRQKLLKLGIIQSMSFAGSGCHGNAKCESMWARFKTEAIYGRYKTELMSMDEVKSLVFRYFMGYWNHRRICSAIGGIPPMEKRRRFLANKQMNSFAA